MAPRTREPASTPSPEPPAHRAAPGRQISAWDPQRRNPQRRKPSGSGGGPGRLAATVAERVGACGRDHGPIQRAAEPVGRAESAELPHQIGQQRRRQGPAPSRALPLPGSNCSPPSVVLLRDHQGERTTASDSTPPTAGGVATTAAHRSARVTPRRAAPRGFRSAVVPAQRLQWFQLQTLSMPPRVAGLKSVPRV